MNKYFVQLADMPWLNIFLGGIAAAALYYFTMFDDGSSLKATIEQSGVRLEEAKRQLAQTEKAMQNANRFEREVRETARQFESIVDYMPVNLRSSDLNGIITKNAQFAGVRVSKIEPKGPDQTSAFYQTTRMGMVLEGSFAQIVTFLANLSRAPNLLTFEGTKLKAGKGSDNSPTLIFEAILVGYRYQKQETPPPGPTAANKPAKAPPAAGGE